MRRIIERVVTVVTTTTWKISWDEDPLPPKPVADPVPDEFPSPDVPREATQPGEIMIETKEADLPEKENEPDQT